MTWPPLGSPQPCGDTAGRWAGAGVRLGELLAAAPRYGVPRLLLGPPACSEVPCTFWGPLHVLGTPCVLLGPLCALGSPVWFGDPLYALGSPAGLGVLLRALRSPACFGVPAACSAVPGTLWGPLLCFGVLSQAARSPSSLSVPLCALGSPCMLWGPPALPEIPAYPEVPACFGAPPGVSQAHVPAGHPARPSPQSPTRCHRSPKTGPWGGDQALPGGTGGEGAAPGRWR